MDVDLLSSGGTFFETPYGRGLWASTWTDARLDWTLVASLVERSYRIVAQKRMLSLLDGALPEPKRPARSAGRPRHAR